MSYQVAMVPEKGNLTEIEKRSEEERRGDRCKIKRTKEKRRKKGRKEVIR